MRTLCAVIVLLLLTSATAYAEIWQAGEIRCEAKVQNNKIEIIIGEQGTLVSIGRHLPSGEYSWLRTIDTASMKLVSEDPVTNCAISRPKSL